MAAAAAAKSTLPLCDTFFEMQRFTSKVCISCSNISLSNILLLNNDARVCTWPGALPKLHVLHVSVIILRLALARDSLAHHIL